MKNDFQPWMDTDRHGVLRREWRGCSTIHFAAILEIRVEGSFIRVHPCPSVVDASSCLALIFAGCSFAPKYTQPPVETPAAFKENSGTNLWKVAQPERRHEFAAIGGRFSTTRN